MTALGADSPPTVGLVVAAAAAPGTFAGSLAARSAVDQGIVTGLATGLHHLLSVGAQETLLSFGRFLAGPAGPAPVPAWRRPTLLADALAVPLGFAVARALPAHPGEPALRGLARQAAWRFGATGLAGTLLVGAESAVRRVDTALGLHGRLAAVPLAVPVGLAVSFVVERRRRQPRDGDRLAGLGHPSAVPSLAVAGGVVGAASAAAYAEHLLADLLGHRLAARLPGRPELWRMAGHAAALAGLGTAVTGVWQRAMRRIEAGTSADAPVIEPGEATRWLPSTVSGGPGSLVPWATLGREGRRHALAVVRPEPLPNRPAGAPDLSISSVMGEPALATPVQVYVGLDSAADPRERVRLALRELDRTGAFDRSLLVLISPTGTGYVNYVASAALAYLTRGDLATVTLQYSRRPSPLSLGMIETARQQNRLLWLEVLERLRDRPAPRPRVVLFGESLGAHTSQDVFLHWGTLGLEALGIDRALWIGTPYGSKWRRQVAEGGRLDVDDAAVAVVNDAAALAELAPARRATVRYVLLSHDNDGVTRFGLDLLWTPPAWLGPQRPRPAPVDGASPRGVPPGMRWRPLTTFFQSLIDMKNAQLPGPFGAWAHDYRADLPRFLSEVYGLPATPAQLARIEQGVRRREAARERLFATRGSG